MASAKHPQVVALLQRALEGARPEQNGVGTTVEAAPTTGGEMKPISKQRDKSVSMAKISNYGGCWQSKPSS